MIYCWRYRINFNNMLELLFFFHRLWIDSFVAEIRLVNLSLRMNMLEVLGTLIGEIS